MDINTTIIIDNDSLYNALEDEIRDTIEEMLSNNDNNYQDYENVEAIVEEMMVDEDTIEEMVEQATDGFIDASDVQDLIDEANQDVSDLINLSNEHDRIIEGMRGDLAILMHQLEMHEIGHRNRSLKVRARRVISAVKALPSRLHFYSPFMKGR